MLGVTIIAELGTVSLQQLRALLQELLPLAQIDGDASSVDARVAIGWVQVDYSCLADGAVLFEEEELSTLPFRVPVFYSVHYRPVELGRTFLLAVIGRHEVWIDNDYVTLPGRSFRDACEANPDWDLVGTLPSTAS